MYGSLESDVMHAVALRNIKAGEMCRVIVDPVTGKHTVEPKED